MKIQHIKITNITSLRGVHQVPLEEMIGNDGLFAITGPTGSGKSSILTAITLALYGIGHKSKLSAIDYVSSAEEFGEIELQFEFKKENYLAFWSLRTVGTRGRALAKPILERKLFKNGIPQDYYPDTLLGLSFEQFTKTVILNQGEFARFLTSNFTERKKILENLYEGEGLSEISRILKNEIKECEASLAHLEALMKAILPLSEQEAQFKKEELKKNQLTYQDGAQRLNKLKELETQLNKVSDLYSDEQKLQKKKTDKKNRLLIEEKEFFEQQIKKKNKTLQIKELQQKRLEQRSLFDLAHRLYERLENLESMEQKRNNRKNEIKKNIETLRTQKDQKQSELLTLLSKFNTLHCQINPQSAERDNIQNLASHEFNQSLILWTTQNQEKFNLSETRQEYFNDLNSIESEALNHKKKIEELEKSMPSHQSEKLKTSFDKLQGAMKLFVNQKAISSQNYLQIGLLTKEQKELDQTKELQARELEKTKDKLDELKKLQAKKDYDQWRAHFHQLSQDAGHCIICQSELSPELKNHSIEEKEETVAHSTDLSLIEEENQKLQVSYQMTIQRLQAIKKRIEEYDNQLRQFMDSFKLGDSPQCWDKHQAILEGEIESVRTLLNDIERKRQTILSHQEYLDRERSRYSQKRDQILKIEREIKKIEEDFRQTNQSIKNFLTKAGHPIHQLSSEVISQYLQMVQLSLQMHPMEQSLKLLESTMSNEDEQLKEIVLEEKEHFENKLLTQTQWNNSQTQLQSTFLPYMKTGILPSTPDEIQSQLDLWSQEKDHELAFIENEFLEKKKIKESSEQLLIHLDEQFKAIEQAIAHHRSRLKELIPEVMLMVNEPLVSTLEKITTAIIEEDLIPMPTVQVALATLLEDQIKPLTSKHEQQQQSLIQLINADKALLDLYDQKIAQQRIYEKEYQSLFSALKTKKDLSLVLGKDEFRSFALGLIEDQLIALTNIELNKLCEGRYHLRPTKTTLGQDFMIIDHFRYGHERKIETLSGGETFLVSLALALSLAEMSRGTTEINCFFIDEGFGSLDQDALEDVLDVLHAIRNRGKQLGIISHIKELTERIPVVIHLQKNAHGHSEILSMQG